MRKLLLIITLFSAGIMYASAQQKKINGTVIGSTFLATFHDQRGNSIGLIEIGMKFTTGEESEAAKFARSVQRELEGEIRSKMAFFQHTQ